MLPLLQLLILILSLLLTLTLIPLGGGGTLTILPSGPKLNTIFTPPPFPPAPKLGGGGPLAMITSNPNPREKNSLPGPGSCVAPVPAAAPAFAFCGSSPCSITKHQPPSLFKQKK
ncbi:hypothetical protein BDQ17DRAFT_1093977 [Cyathus striatus]|nr:hypothetical protein BDQ17DRAFT_1093977 [Cyathus striatus]